MTTRRSLQVTDLRVAYGPVVALAGASLEVVPGTVRVLLGPNGAGKTSLLNGVCGVAPRVGGTVTLGELELHKQRSYNIARSGVIQVPEGRRVVAPLSVEENLLLGKYAARGREVTDGVYDEVDAIYELFPRLESRRHVRAGLLSGGEQQMLAIGRALMGQPEVMLLDEPSMGLAPIIVALVFDCVARIAASGIGVLMVEQNVAALEIASYGYVLDQGKIVVEGAAESLAGDSSVVDAYIGSAAAKREPSRA
jgi:branched-chain amino acid transport system ATP-binding protein